MNRAREDMKDTTGGGRMFARYVRSVAPQPARAGGWPSREVAGESDRVGRPRFRVFGEARDPLPEPLSFTLRPSGVTVRLHVHYARPEQWERIPDEDRPVEAHFHDDLGVYLWTTERVIPK